MRVTVRLPRPLLDEVRADLARPHRFAAERIGFLYGRLRGAGDGQKLILLTGYAALDDARYIDDPEVGTADRQPGNPPGDAGGPRPRRGSFPRAPPWAPRPSEV